MRRYVPAGLQWTVPNTGVPFVDPAAYQEFLVQQINAMSQAGGMGGATVSSQDPLQDPNLQALLYHNAQMQYVWVQQHQEMLRRQQEYLSLQQTMDSTPGHNHPPPQQQQRPELASYSPVPPPQGQPQPVGLFIPPVAPEQQRRAQALQRPRSQAIPIVSPEVCLPRALE